MVKLVGSTPEIMQFFVWDSEEKPTGKFNGMTIPDKSLLMSVNSGTGNTTVHAYNQESQSWVKIKRGA